jgi:hypothetical protein
MRGLHGLSANAVRFTRTANDLTATVIQITESSRSFITGAHHGCGELPSFTTAVIRVMETLPSVTTGRESATEKALNDIIITRDVPATSLSSIEGAIKSSPAVAE